jgi:hypothetical protein
MWPKIEAWIPKLGFLEVDVTQPAWRIDVAENQSLDSESWIS